MIVRSDAEDLPIGHRQHTKNCSHGPALNISYDASAFVTSKDIYESTGGARDQSLEAFGPSIPHSTFLSVLSCLKLDFGVNTIMLFMLDFNSLLNRGVLHVRQTVRSKLLNNDASVAHGVRAVT